MSIKNAVMFSSFYVMIYIMIPQGDINMNSIIDSSDYNSFPKEFIKTVIDKINNMPPVERQKLVISNDINIIKKYFDINGNNYYWYQNTLIPLMNKYNFICFHSTKVYDKNLILDNGLKINEWNTYSKTMSDIFFKVGIYGETQRKALEYIKKEYDRKIRNPEICFFSGLNLISNDYTDGYEKWCESMGGELASWALEEKMPDVYKLLKSNGEAYYVKFKLKFDKFCIYCKDSILKELLVKVISKEFWNKEYEVRFDGKTLYDVPKENILQLITCNYKF